MTSHPSDAELIQLREEGTPAGVLRGLRDHLVACEDCRERVSGLDFIEKLLGAGAEAQAAEGVEGSAGILSQDLDRRLDRIIANAAAASQNRDSRPQALQFRRASVLRAGLALAGCAALALFWLRGPYSDPSPPAPPRVVLDQSLEAVRGSNGSKYHFEIILPRPAHALILALDGSEVRVVYPHPNPVFGTFGRTEPFAANQAFRLPPDAEADFSLEEGAALPAFVLVPTATQLDDDARAALVRAGADAVGSLKGAAAVQRLVGFLIMLHADTRVIVR